MEQQKWIEWLENERQKKYYKEIFMKQKKLDRKRVNSPDLKYRESFLNFSNIDDVRVIIVDNEPNPYCYQSNGLALSSLDELTFLEKKFHYKIKTDLGVTLKNNKEDWLKRGIVPFCSEVVSNTTSFKKTVIWQEYTDNILRYFIQHPQPKVFVFLGRVKSSDFIETIGTKHLYIDTTLMGNAFTKKDIFNKINNFIYSNYNEEVIWNAD